MKKIVLLTVVFYLVLNSIFIWAILRETEEEFDAMSEIIANQTSNAMEFWMDEQLKFAQLIAENHVLSDFCQMPEDEALRKRAEDLLRRHNERYDFYDSMPITLVSDKPILTVVNGKVMTLESGQIIADTTGQDAIGKVELPKTDIERLLNGSPYSRGEVHASYITGNPVFDLSVPIKSGDEVVGIFTLSTHLDYFTEKFVDVHRIGETGYMFMLDSRGVIVAHPNRDIILLDTPDRSAQAEEFMAFIKSGQHRFVQDLIGVKKYYYGKRMDSSFNEDSVHYYVVISQHLTETLDEVFQLSAIVGILSLVAGVLLIRMNMTLTEVHTRRQHELQLLDMNKLLEAKVDARTSELKRMAVTDGLTGLYNHQYSHDLLEELVLTSQANVSDITVILLDLDNFKQINDSFGHQVGDDVLKQVAKIMQAQIRAGDFVGRYGGEEFLVVLRNCPLESGIAIGQRMRQRIASEDFDQVDYTVTISGGLCRWNGESVKELIKRVDKLLYKAKENGRNRIVNG